jgi:hypothetical protein
MKIKMNHQKEVLLAYKNLNRLNHIQTNMRNLTMISRSLELLIKKLERGRELSDKEIEEMKKFNKLYASTLKETFKSKG